MRYLSEFFWRNLWYIDRPIPNNSEFLVCLSVCQLAYFLSEIRHLQRYLLFWMKYLSEIFWGHSWDVGSLVPNNTEIVVCLSVCQLAYFLTEIRQIKGYLQFWMKYLSEIFWRHFWYVGRPIPNNSEILATFCHFCHFCHLLPLFASFLGGQTHKLHKYICVR